ncbi:DUF5777 family beta-barrel protein [Balneola sp. MJW-20]|uniref:DUF5777 family beta-barrel protein n=1 Tax=Gracilimonas aurantiaca TaxID=3234185 RepID=UPI003467856F
MKRERAFKDRPVSDIFSAYSIAGVATVESVAGGNLNSVVLHNFGLVSGGLEDFYGLDQGAAVRLGIDYGISDRLSVGIGRTSREDNVDLRFKYTLLQQMESGKIPVQVVFKGDLGINTQKENRFDFTFNERLNYLGSVMIARKWGDRISTQVTPMVSHFNTIIEEVPDVQQYHTIYGLGLLARYKLSNKYSFSAEYLPVIGNRNEDTYDHIAVAFEINTGGHVFQIFAMSGNWFTEQHLLARTNTNFLDLDFRLGFNINRVYKL